MLSEVPSGISLINMLFLFLLDSSVFTKTVLVNVDAVSMDSSEDSVDHLESSSQDCNVTESAAKKCRALSKDAEQSDAAKVESHSKVNKKSSNVASAEPVTSTKTEHTESSKEESTKAAPLPVSDHHIDGNALKPHIMIFDENKILRKCIFDTILYKVSIACTKIRMQSLPK